LRSPKFRTALKLEDSPEKTNSTTITTITSSRRTVSRLSSLVYKKLPASHTTPTTTFTTHKQPPPHAITMNASSIARAVHARTPSISFLGKRVIPSSCSSFPQSLENPQLTPLQRTSTTPPKSTPSLPSPSSPSPSPNTASAPPSTVPWHPRPLLTPLFSLLLESTLIATSFPRDFGE
jgi:hypothetical protein